MRIEGVLLGTVEEQRAGGDPNPIDPGTVACAVSGVPLTISFDRRQLVGHVHRIWTEYGRLMFDADVDDEHAGAALPVKAAIGVMGCRDDDGVIRGAELYEVGLTNQNQNRNHPDWTQPGLMAPRGVLRGLNVRRLDVDDPD